MILYRLVSIVLFPCKVTKKQEKRQIYLGFSESDFTKTRNGINFSMKMQPLRAQQSHHIAYHSLNPFKFFHSIHVRTSKSYLFLKLLQYIAS